MTSRIENHPILGEPEKGQLVSFTFDGRELEGYEGEPIAMALKAAGVMVHRYTSKKHEPRGIFCAIGRCTDCVMIVNGVPNTRTCITPLEAGMTVQTQYGVSAEPFDSVPGVVNAVSPVGATGESTTASESAQPTTASANTQPAAAGQEA